MLAYLDPGDDEGLSGLAVFLIVFAIVTVWLGASFFVAKYAERKGQSFLGFALLGILVSPLISLIAAIIVGDRSPVAPPAQPAGSHLDELKKLSELRDTGTLSAEEFKAEKARIMSTRE